MKTLRISMLAILAIFAVSCDIDDVENRPVVQGIDAPVLNSPEEGNVYVLTDDNADVLAERFVWTAANFGEGIIPTYEVEIDSAGQSFDTPVIVGSTNGTTQLAVTNNVLNTALIALGATPEVSASFDVRIKAYVGTEVMYSNSVEISVTPYQGIIPIQQLYILGTATEFGYDNNADNTPLFRDASNQFLFHYTGYFSAGELKLISTKGSWQPQYGGAGGVLAVNDGTGSDPAAIVVPAAGYYTFTVNIEENTYSLENFDDAAAPIYSTIGIIGAATPTGWDADTDLVNTPGNTHIWHISAMTLTTEGAKFREGDAWTNSWGDANFPAGKGNNANDPNIPAVAGSYDVWFNDLDGRYLFIPAN